VNVNGYIKAGVQFSLPNEMIERTPADYVRHYAAQRAGDLLRELLLNPEADPFTELQLRAEQLVPEFLTDSVTVRLQLTCARTPKYYEPIAPPRFEPTRKGLE
jgi:hypothetical protein